MEEKSNTCRVRGRRRLGQRDALPFATSLTAGHENRMSYVPCVKHIIYLAALLSFAAVFSPSLTALAQTNPVPMSGEHHYLHLTPTQKARVQSFISATLRIDQNAAPMQRRANKEKLRRRISGILAPDQLEQFDAELAKIPPGLHSDDDCLPDIPGIPAAWCKHGPPRT